MSDYPSPRTWNPQVTGPTNSKTHAWLDPPAPSRTNWPWTFSLPSYSAKAEHLTAGARQFRARPRNLRRRLSLTCQSGPAAGAARGSASHPLCCAMLFASTTCCITTCRPSHRTDAGLAHTVSRHPDLQPHVVEERLKAWCATCIPAGGRNRATLAALNFRRRVATEEPLITRTIPCSLSRRHPAKRDAARFLHIPAPLNN